MDYLAVFKGNSRLNGPGRFMHFGAPTDEAAHAEALRAGRNRKASAFVLYQKDGPGGTIADILGEYSTGKG